MRAECRVIPLATIVSCLLLTCITPSAVSGGESNPGWGTVVLLEYDDSGAANYPQVATDRFGNAVAVWQQQDGFRNHIWSNRYVVGEGWGEAEMIEDEPVASAVNPRVAVDPAGNAVAVWEQVGAVGLDIWSNRYVVDEGWGAAELVEASSLGSATGPEVAVDSLGNAVVVWVQVDLYQQSIWSSRYSPGAGWGTPELIEYDDSTAAFNPDVSVDPSGNATAVWEHWGGPAMTIWSNRYVVGEGWGETELVDTGTPTGSFNPEVAMDSSGNAVAVWERWNVTSFEIAANRYVAGVGWGTSGYIGTGGGGDALGPKVTVDDAGDATAVWSKFSDGYCNIWSNRYVSDTGWGSPEKLGVDRTGTVRYPQVGSDRSGNAIAVWEEWDGSRMEIWSNRYVAGAGWGVSEMTHPDDWCIAVNPQVAVDREGNAVAVWQMTDGVRYSIWSSRFVAPDTTAPELRIDSPSDGLTTEEPTVIVAGTTEPGVALDINGLLASVGDDGSFSCAVALVEGVNILTATARDASGNCATASVTVTYTDPAEALEDALEAALKDLAALQEEYAHVSAYSEELEALLDAVLAELVGIRSDLNDSEESYSAIRDSLDNAVTNLTAAQEDLDSARSQNLLLTVVAIVLAAALGAVSIMSRRQRRGPE